MCSECLKPPNKIGVVSPSWGPAGAQWFDTAQGVSLRFEVEREIFVRSVDADMTEPMGDGAQVDTGAEEMDRGGVPHAVRMDSFMSEIWRIGHGRGDVSFEDQARPEACERLSAVIAEKAGGRDWRELLLGEKVTN